jgi:hypothetical protein
MGKRHKELVTGTCDLRFEPRSKGSLALGVVRPSPPQAFGANLNIFDKRASKGPFIPHRDRSRRVEESKFLHSGG